MMKPVDCGGFGVRAIRIEVFDGLVAAKGRGYRSSFYTPMSSFQSSGLLAMNPRISSTQVAS